MNKIINPQNGLEYDLFSQEGLHILNMFIRTYKKGGSQDVEGDVEEQQRVPLTERVTDFGNAVLRTVADLDVRAEEVAVEFVSEEEVSIFDHFKNKFNEIVDEAVFNEDNPRNLNLYQINLFVNLIIVTLFFCNLSAIQFGLDEPILDKLIKIMFQYIEKISTADTISLGVTRLFQIIKYLSLPTVIAGSITLLADVARARSLAPAVNKMSTGFELILGGVKVGQKRLGNIRSSIIKSLLTKLLNIAEKMTNKEYNIKDYVCSISAGGITGTADFLYSKLTDSADFARTKISNLILSGMSEEDKYINGLLSFGTLLTFAASTTYCPSFSDGLFGNILTSLSGFTPGAVIMVLKYIYNKASEYGVTDWVGELIVNYLKPNPSEVKDEKLANGILEEFEGEYVFTLERRIDEDNFEDAEREWIKFGNKREGLTRQSKSMVVDNSSGQVSPPTPFEQLEAEVKNALFEFYPYNNTGEYQTLIKLDKQIKGNVLKDYEKMVEGQDRKNMEDLVNSSKDIMDNMVTELLDIRYEDLVRDDEVDNSSQSKKSKIPDPKNKTKNKKSKR